MKRVVSAKDIIAALLALMLVSACRQSTKAPVFTSAERCSIDSLLMPMKHSADSLRQAIADFSESHNTLGEIVANRMLGSLLRIQNQFEKAMEYNNRSFRLAKDVGDTLNMIRALNEVGTNFRRIGSLENATEAHLKAIILSDNLSDTSTEARKARVMSLNGIGNVYLTMGNLEMADSMLRMALEGERQLGSDLGQAINWANIGSIMKERGQLDSAWQCFSKSMEFNRKASSLMGISLCHTHFGELYEVRGDIDNALAEYSLARNLMIDSHDEWHRMQSDLNLVRLYIKRDDYDKAFDHLKKADSTAVSIASIEHQSQVHHLYSELYEKLGNTALALQHFKKFEELTNNLVDISKMNHIQNLRIRMEHNRSRHAVDLAMQNATLEHTLRQVLLIVIVVILLLAIGIIGFLWYHLRNRTKNQRLQQTMQQTREMFFTNITHEFRTPLTVILGLGHQLEDSEAGDMAQVRSAAKMIVRQGNSLLGLINQLLDISKVRSAVGTARWRQGNIVAYTQMVTENFLPYAQSKRQELTFSHSLTNIEMDFVPEYMQRILSNLLANAIKYTPEYGKINLTLEQTANGRIRLTVFDTGRGIDPKVLPRIFDPFIHGEHQSGDVASGIGLSLVKMLVDAMGGTISVESQLGQGSTFAISLPTSHPGTTDTIEETDMTFALTQLSTPISAEQDNSESTAAKLANDDLTPRVLIVEDNQDIAYYIGMHLQRQSRLLYAHDADEAFTKAIETMPDMIITDIMMPGPKNGIDLCRLIRQNELLSHIPIIIITAKTSEADRVEGFKAGADAYLVKPFNSDELMVRFKKLMERQRVMREKFAGIDGGDSDKKIPMTAANRQFMNHLVDTVYRLMAQGSVDMESVASEMAVSRTQLNRKIMAITGQNSSTYIMRLRLARAKRLLKADVTMPIGDVAQRCGFDDVAYFSRIFKQTFSMTPSQYRKSEL